MQPEVLRTNVKAANQHIYFNSSAVFFFNPNDAVNHLVILL